LGALLIQSDPFFNSVAAQLVALARRYSVAVIYGRREFAAAGGLMGYGSRLSDSYRQLRSLRQSCHRGGLDPRHHGCDSSRRHVAKLGVEPSH
jgi:hypothetical protein